MRFTFFKTSTEVSTPSLNVDLHSHLIPAIDDGSKDMAESLGILKALEEAGYHKVITTPHVMLDGYCNTKKGILQGLEALRVSAKAQGLKIQIEAAAEYYLDEGLLKHLEADSILPLSGKYILFETSYMAKPLHFDSMIETLIDRGYTPVFAHPERYRYIENLEEDYTQLKKQGIYFQVNINSFGGHYGKDAKRKALFLSEHGMIDFLGSDIHHIKQVKTLVKVKRKTIYQDIFKKNLILNNIL
ncbi:MAG: CpsB/CapC family capsule biosynthesis tyrosine phosphatase [Sulfurovum sp.]|nr:CpsB/CapC family capsule biosynthesis tyrosine phosphatase [Sulfurovum sp.]